MRTPEERLKELEAECDTLGKRLADAEKQLELLEKTSVKHSWLNGVAYVIAAGIVTGTLAFMSKLSDAQREMKQEAIAVVKDVATKVDGMERAQTEQKVKVEALYLFSVEKRPRDEVREAVHRTKTGE